MRALLRVPGAFLLRCIITPLRASHLLLKPLESEVLGWQAYIAEHPEALRKAFHVLDENLMGCITVDCLPILLRSLLPQCNAFECAFFETMVRSAARFQNE